MISLFGLPLQNLAFDEAIDRLRHSLERGPSSPPCLTYFVNAHTARLAAASHAYAQLLARADLLLIDGIGVRIAAAMRRARVRANLAGTDLVPALLRRASGSCFLLGGSEPINAAAAARLAARFEGWRVAGRHHGYLHRADDRRVVGAINDSGADLLLVGMGNPLQEEWLDRNAAALRVPLCIAVGGLFHYWAGDLHRASALSRCIGLEWAALCLQRPGRARRYASDIPVFLGLAVLAAGADRRRRPGAHAPPVFDMTPLDPWPVCQDPTTIP